MNLHDRQIELEEQYSAMSIRKGQDLVNTAFTQGRAADVGEIQVLLIKTYDDVMRDLSAFLAHPHRGLNGKYAGLLRRVPVNLLTTMGLRQIIQACANPEPTALPDHSCTLPAPCLAFTGARCTSSGNQNSGSDDT